MGDNVSQDQFNSHLTLIHQTIKDSNERADTHFNKMIRQMEIQSRESTETRMEILMLTKEHTTRLDNHASKIRELEVDVKELNVHKTKTNVYWYFFGTVLVMVLGAIVKFMFS